ncbi:hypothetical protein TWF106_003960 [Orbilia oligospora]|uniref:Uncharacterized protein n=1 Tax=Orbilia oligospora TaxID=2813651 RepID=A0A7C8U9H0_ORBOL|nr:hypothetical protein TWF679_003205 [Orbilia oligospora]KAF3199276.1 hypothetical protein TWF106_003960 [Orbilia oligospora]
MTPVASTKAQSNAEPSSTSSQSNTPQNWNHESREDHKTSAILGRDSQLLAYLHSEPAILERLMFPQAPDRQSIPKFLETIDRDLESRPR